MCLYLCSWVTGSIKTILLKYLIPRLTQQSGHHARTTWVSSENDLRQPIALSHIQTFLIGMNESSQTCRIYQIQKSKSKIKLQAAMNGPRTSLTRGRATVQSMKLWIFMHLWRLTKKLNITSCVPFVMSQYIKCWPHGKFHQMMIVTSSGLLRVASRRRNDYDS